jgi:hypothetical protein
LAAANARRGAALITVTSLDRRDEVREKYAKASESLDALDVDPSVQVLHGVDATDLSPLSKRWDSIVWNFPYPPTGNNDSDGADLLGAFFDGLKESLALPSEEGETAGRVYLTLAPKQVGI